MLVSLLLDVEVFDLIGILVSGNDIEELSEAVLLEVFLGEILKITLGEVSLSLDVHSLVIIVNLD